MKRWVLVGGLLALLAASPATAATDTSRFRQQIQVDALLRTMEHLQRIADDHGGTRASGTVGYAKSVKYVTGVLERKGYDVTIQTFTFPFFQELAPAQFARVAPSPVTYVDDVDFAVMTQSGSGSVTANVQAVDTNATPSLTSTSGCEAGDFAGFVAGRIALVQRGTCPFAQKAVNAQAAGASAVVVFNRGTAGAEGVVLGTLTDPVVSIPVLGASFAVGQALYSTDASVTARVFTSTISETRSTNNVLAETPGGDPSKVVVVGAHLDSVPEGPGVVDNGSGVATVLELASRLHKVADVTKTGPGGLRNKIRFAFWGAEEFGLRGARFYVAGLSPAQRATITLNLNADMIASSNFVYFVTDGDGSTFGTAGPGRSGEAERVLLDYFALRGLPTVPRELDGRSDWQAFNEAGIGFGLVSTGSDQVKTAAQAALFGGTAGQIMHPCYHTACDRLESTAVNALDVTSDAFAHATLWFAQEPAP